VPKKPAAAEGGEGDGKDGKAQQTCHDMAAAARVRQMTELDDSWKQGCFNSGGPGGPSAPLAWRFHRIPTHLPLQSHAISVPMALLVF
jgi:hypothetical protein